MSLAEEHQAYETPPRNGAIMALAFDATSRSYNITALVMGQAFAPEAGLKRRDEVFITVTSETGDAFVSFSQTAATVDDTAVVALGGTPTFGATMAARVSATNVVPRRWRLDRSLDQFLNVKAVAAGSGTLRIYVSSPAAI